jgi:glutamate-1-semialdehyde 2,1-aminomutase
LGAAAGLATLSVLQRPGFYDALFATSDWLLAQLQQVLDRHGVAAMATGQHSFWQLFFSRSGAAQSGRHHAL